MSEKSFAVDDHGVYEGLFMNVGSFDIANFLILL
jgi:hypothetical protein